jgi:small nuclear ribonucleoprotein
MSGSAPPRATKPEKREVVRARLVIAGREFDVAVAVTDRKDMTYHMIVGMEVLRTSGFLVEPSRATDRRTNRPFHRARKPLSSAPRSEELVPMIKPLSLLNQRINSNVMVELKGGRGYRGILEGFDPHMNLVLRAAEETQDNQSQRKMDLAIVRGDNVIYISP